MKTDLRPRSVAILALVLGLAATLLAWYVAGRQVERESQARFAGRARLAAGLLDRRIQRYVDALQGLGALAYQNPQLGRDQFRRYVAALDLDRRFPGMRAVEFVRRVRDAERDPFVASVRSDRSVSPNGYPSFDIHPPGRRGEYWVVDYVEPMTGNEAVFGLDVRMREGAAEAADRAMATGEPMATGRYRLAQELGASYGVVIYLPVYGALAAPATAAQRRAELHGFVNAVLRVDDLFAQLENDPLMSGLRMEVRDFGMVGASLPTRSTDAVFYRSPESTTKPSAIPWAQWTTQQDLLLRVAGREWGLRIEPVPELSPWLTRYPVLAFTAALCVSLLTFAFLWQLARARSEAVETATRATRDLRTQLSFTQQLIEAIPNPVFFKDSGGRYLGCNRAFEDFVGIPREHFLGKTVHDVASADFADRSVIADRALYEMTGPQSYETSLRYAGDGSEHDVLISKATFYAPGGEVAGLVGVLVDITERKQLEAETRESNERLRAVIQAAPIAIIARDLNGAIEMWNPAAERIFGWSESEVMGINTRVVPERFVLEAKALRERAQAGETIWIEETRRTRRDGSEFDASLSIAPIYDGEGRVIGTMVIIADITPRKLAEQALRQSEAQLRLAVEAAQLGMWYWDAETDAFTHSEGLTALFGDKPTERVSDYRLLRDRLHPEDREHLDATLRYAIKHGNDLQVDYRVIWPDGTTHWLTNRGQVHRGPDGRAQRVIGVAMDISDRKLAEQRIAHMAHHDALTGLPNRVLLRDRVQQGIAHAHRNRAHLAVLFLDLDRFKTINDSLGHALGDRLLQSVASRLLVCVREGDTVARVGGDEFVIVVPALTSSADASVVAAKILEALASPFHLNGNDLHVGASIGISLYPADGPDAETLVRNADTAMYYAKDSGRGKTQFFTPHMNVAAQQRLALDNALRHALEHGEFALHFQPLFDLDDRAIGGFEALLRWDAPGHEPVSAAELVAAAEESGLIVPIGEWVLREAMRHAREWQSAGFPVPVAVNVSAYQLERPSFVERLRVLLEESGIDPALLELEVTEGVIIESAGAARAALDQVAALGVGIAIDDFGTGYSGLAYLKRLPIDTLKIDQSFVRDLTVDPDDAAIVTAILAMASSLGLDVVAEGVETAEQLDELKRLGCRRGQGFLLAAPMDGASALALLRTTARATATAD